MIQRYPSQLLERAVQEFSKLPGIGRKTALRLVLYQLRQDPEDVQSFVEAIAKMKQEVHYCRRCHNISDSDLCPICANQRRDSSTICVVENVQDVMAVENTQQYRGLYHVLGEEEHIQEVILALSSTMEGDTTNFYIFRKLAPYDVRLSIIARGIPVGDELEYADEVTLGRSILNRTPFEGK